MSRANFSTRVVCVVMALLGGALGSNAAWSDAEFIDAVRSGERELALEKLRAKVDVNEPASDGTTALHWAVYRNDADLVRRLLKAGAKANVANDYGSTPMSEAAVAGNPEVLQMLLKAGADVESPNADGQTALMVLARTSNLDAAKVLLRHRAKVNAVETRRGQTALMWAAAENQPAMVALLVKHGADVDAVSHIRRWQRQVTGEPRAQARPSGGMTPLLFAARRGCEECARTLVEAGADLDKSDPEGVTPLIIAINNFNFDIAAYLLDKGANPNKWDWWGRTPLYSAVDMNTLPFGGRPDRPSLDRTTGLQLIEMLLKAGANPDARLKLLPPFRSLGADRGADLMLTIDATALLRAAKAGDAPAVRLLLEHGANPHLPNINGVTPLMAAAGLASNEIDTRGRFKTPEQGVECIELLVKAGADVNARDAKGQTALHGAALWGWNAVIKSLVAHDADLQAKDANGKTPLDTALGKNGGHGRGSTRIEVHEDTAALIRELTAQAGG